MKKFLATVLALMLLALPCAGMAETMPDLNAFLAGDEDYYTTALEAGRRITFTVDLSDVATDFTGEPAVDQVIHDLLGGLSITGYVQADEVFYAIGMKQENGDVAQILTMGAAVAGEDAYILTNLIGGTIVVSQDEVLPLLERVVDMMVRMGFLSEQEAAFMKAELRSTIEMAQQKATATANAGLAGVDFTSLDYSALMGIFTMVSDKMVAGEADVLPKNCDPAAGMITVTMTPADMKALVAGMLQFVKDNPALADAIAAEIDFDNTIAPEISGVSGEPVTFMGFIDMALAKLETEEFYESDVVLRMWVDENGDVVAMDCTSEDMTFNYSRLTVNEGVAHTFQMAFPGGDITLSVLDGGDHVVADFAAAENGKTVMSMRIDYTDRSYDKVQAGDIVLDMYFNEATFNASGSYGGQTYSSSTVEKDVNIRLDITSETVIDGVDFTEKEQITVSVNGKEYATVNVAISSDEPGASIMSGSVVRPAELTDNDFATWFIGAFNAMYSWATNAIFAMPVSLINLINTAH